MKADKLREEYAAKTTGERPLLTNYAMWLEDKLSQLPTQEVGVSEGDIERMAWDFAQDQTDDEGEQIDAHDDFVSGAKSILRRLQSLSTPQPERLTHEKVVDVLKELSVMHVKTDEPGEYWVISSSNTEEVFKDVATAICSLSTEPEGGEQ